MQATCPQCSQVIAVDDAKVPAGPFMLRCPRCQNAMRLSGNGAEKPAAEAPAPQKAPPPPQQAAQTPPPPVEHSPPAPRRETKATPSTASGESPPAPAPQKAPPPQGSETEVSARAAPRSSQYAGSPPPSAAPQQPQPSNGHPSRDAIKDNGQRALVELPEAEHAASVIKVLQQQGYTVDTMDRWDERAIELQQGVYDLVVTHRNGLASTPKNGLFPLVNGLPPELRSRLFLVLVGDTYKTGNTNEAFAAMADFVCHPQDVPAAESLLRTTIAEKGRLYRAYLDVLRKKEAGEL